MRLYLGYHALMVRPVVVALAMSVVALTASAPSVSSNVTQPGWAVSIEPIDSPAPPGSGQPQLSVSDRGVLLSWIERSGTTATLKFSERKSGAWTPARAVASGDDWFVNWADVPSVMRLANGALAAHWLQKSGTGTYAYDVRLSHSSDDGKTWAASVTPHSDGTKSEHGFGSLFPAPGAGLGLVWLDGRAMKPGHGGHGGGGNMSLRYGAFGRDWKQVSEIAVDSRVCECCPTAAAVTADGPIVAYRDRGPDDTRDIYVARLENGKWSDGKPVHKDGWIFPACPVNGPALSARGRDVAIAWYTGVNGAPRSFAAFSSDAGRSFGAPILVDDNGSLGRVDVELLADGAAAVTYIAVTPAKAAEFRVRRVERGGTASAPVVVAPIAAGRASGYPRMAADGKDLVFAWIDATSPQIRTAVARLK
jgi:hypothetical protein